MAKKTDQKILNLIKLAKDKKEAIRKVENPVWKTNCSFSFCPENASRINLHTVSDIPLLISMAGFLHGRENDFNAAKIILGFESDLDVSFNWMGFSVPNWINDIKLRIAKLEIKKEKESLEEIESRLNKLISPELRAELELKEIESMLV